MRVKQGDSILPMPHTILPAAELNRHLDAASDAESLRGRNFRLDLPMAKVNTAKMTLVTVSLSPAPRSAVASVLTASPTVPAPVQAKNAPPMMRQFTAAFGSPSPKFGPRLKGSGKFPSNLPNGSPLSAIPASPSVKSPAKKFVSRFRTPSTRRRPIPLDLTDVTMPVVRPLPAITTKFEAPQKVDKGKGRASPSPTTLLVERDATSRSRAALRPLPQFPRNSTASSSSIERSRPGPAASAVTHERHGSLSSLSSVSSIYSSQCSPKTSILPTSDSTIEWEDSIDSESSSSSSFEKRKRARQSERSTCMTVWSQESAVSLAIKDDRTSAENVPKRQEVPASPRVQIPPSLRPGNLVAKLSVQGMPLWLRT